MASMDLDVPSLQPASTENVPNADADAAAAQIASHMSSLPYSDPSPLPMIHASPTYAPISSTTAQCSVPGIVGMVGVDQDRDFEDTKEIYERYYEERENQQRAVPRPYAPVPQHQPQLEREREPEPEPSSAPTSTDLEPFFVVEDDDMIAESTQARPPLVMMWDPELDALLRDTVLRLGTKSWTRVKRELDGWNGAPINLRDRWVNIQNVSVKGPWSTAEDDLLRVLVNIFGAKKWSLSASHFPGRAGKQCRERWLNHLDMNVTKTDWSQAEDNILLRNQETLGNKWSEIAKMLPGRSENAVKNRFNSISSRLRAGETVTYEVKAPVAYNVVALPRKQHRAPAPTMVKSSSTTSTNSESSSEPAAPKGKKASGSRSGPSNGTSRAARLAAAAASASSIGAAAAPTVPTVPSCGPPASGPPASGPELMNTIFSTIGRDLPDINNRADDDFGGDFNDDDYDSDDCFDVDDDGNPVLPETTSNPNNAVARAAIGLDLGIANSVDCEEFANAFEGSEAEMKALLVTKAALDKEVEREKLFSEVMLGVDELKAMRDDLMSGRKPAAAIAAALRQQQQLRKQAAVKIGSNSVENAAFNEFLLDGPDVDLLMSYGDMSLGESASLNLSVADDGIALVQKSKDKNLEISFSDLNANDKSSFIAEQSWDVNIMGSLSIDPSAAPALNDCKNQESPRLPTGRSTPNTTASSGSGSGYGASINTTTASSSSSVIPDRMSFSIPNTPLGTSSDTISLENALKESGADISTTSTAMSPTEGRHKDSSRHRKMKTKQAFLNNSLTPLERLLKRAEGNAEQYEPTPLNQMTFTEPAKIKGRLGGGRKKRGKTNVDDPNNNEEWQTFLNNDAAVDEKKTSEAAATTTAAAPPSVEATRMIATTFGDATIEAAIAASSGAAPNTLTVDVCELETPPPSDDDERDKVWPGVMAFCYNAEEGDTQRLPRKKPASEKENQSHKRSRPASRDSIGSYGKLSVVSSIADLTVDRMSLTNSVKSLSLDDGDWNPTKDATTGNHQLNPNMQMSELMKIGWELRPSAASPHGEQVSASRGGSAESRSSLGKSLGLSFSVKGMTRDKDVKTLEDMDMDTAWIAPVKPKGKSRGGSRAAGSAAAGGRGGNARAKKSGEEGGAAGSALTVSAMPRLQRESSGSKGNNMKSPLKRVKKVMEDEREKERSGTFIAPTRPVGRSAPSTFVPTGVAGGHRTYVQITGPAPMRTMASEEDPAVDSFSEERSMGSKGGRGGLAGRNAAFYRNVVLNIE